MDDDLHSLAYYSHSVLPPDRAGMCDLVADILLRARRNNRRLKITGALLFSGGCFAQVLEGPLDAVEQLFEIIQCDGRHANVTILHFHKIAERSFPHWSMAFAGIDTYERGQALAANALGSPGEVPTFPQSEGFVDVLRNLVELHALAE